MMMKQQRTTGGTSRTALRTMDSQRSREKWWWPHPNICWRFFIAFGCTTFLTTLVIFFFTDLNSQLPVKDASDPSAMDSVITPVPAHPENPNVKLEQAKEPGVCTWQSDRNVPRDLEGHGSSNVEARRIRVAVVGGGLSGLSAAIEILRGGGSVVVIEKSPRLGGNSAKASSGINAANSTSQIALGIEDNPEDFKADTMKSGKGRSTSELVDVLVTRSAGAISFLQGFDIDLSNIAQLGGHSHPRTHRSRSDGKVMNIGWRIMSSLIKFMDQQPFESVQILQNARATSLIVDDRQQVIGVNVEMTRKSASGQEIKEKMDVFADAVVLATGGFSADKDGLLKEYVPGIRNLATTNGAFATGDGIKIAKKVGAGIVDMDQVQLHPTGFVDPNDPTNPVKFLAPESLRGCGGILLNQKGERFVDELTTRDAVTEAILEKCAPFVPLKMLTDASGGIAAVTNGGGKLSSDDAGKSAENMPVSAFMLMTEEGIDKFDRDIANFYMKKGFITRFENAAELCKAFSLPEEKVVSVLQKYGRETEDPFGKKVFPTMFNPSDRLYALIVTPSLHYTMGGLKFSASGQILKDDGVPIPGLFGAGEVTGGLHGANRLGGNSLLECVVYGRIAGFSACKSKYHASM